MVKEKKIKQAVGCLMALTMVMTNSYMGIGVINQKNTIVYAETLTYTVGNSAYNYVILENGTVEITRYRGTDTEIVIPEEIDGKSVTSIGERAFSYCSSLTSVGIPNGVTGIGKNAFEGCISLTSVEIPISVASIGFRAFENCSSLTSVKIPNSVTNIGDYVFRHCSGLTSVEIPNSVTGIGKNAFENCSSLTSVKIPNSVTSIGADAFNGCSSLTSVKIPNSVTSIGESAFYDCSSLEIIEVETGNAEYSSQEGILFSADMSKIIQYPSGKKNESYIIPNSVTNIGDNAFSYCSSLTSVKIPNSVISIGESAFERCISLRSVEIPNSVTSICRATFWGCSSLKSVKIPDSVTSICRATFWGCSSLTSVEISNSVTDIGDSAFEYCSSLTSIEIPNSVISIGESAFERCISLRSVEIPNSVTSIGESAFYDCSSLETIKVETGNVEYSSQEGILFSVDMSEIIQYPSGKKNESYIIPNNVISIGYGAFGECNNLTSIVMPDSVTSIGKKAFDRCRNLKNVKISDNITVIDNNTFYECYSLENIVIPNNVTSIGEGAFWRCRSLTSVEIPDSVTNIGHWAFKECIGLKSIDIPNSVKSIDAYAFSECSSLEYVKIPESVEKIGDSAFEYCSSLMEVELSNGIEEIYDGMFYSCNSLTSIEIPSSVTNIGWSAFYGCSSLTSIEIPNSVTTIGYGAFNGCSSLEKIEVEEENQHYKSKEGILFSADMSEIIQYPGGKKNESYVILDSVNSIDDRAFSDCSNLVGVVIPNSVTNIGREAFSGCSRLEKIDVEAENKNYKSQDGVLFDINMTELIKYPDGKKDESYIIPEGITSIGYYALADCSNLAEVKIPNSVMRVGYMAFSGCSRLEKIDVEAENKNYKSQDGVLFDINMTELIKYPDGKKDEAYIIPEGITSIVDYALTDCSSLVEVKIPNSVTEMGIQTFDGCKKLESIVVGEENKYYATKDGILYSKSMDTIIKYPSGRKGDYVMPDSVSHISDGQSKAGDGEGAFYACKELTRIEISEGISEIGNLQFVECNNLEFVKIPDTVEYIYPDVFLHCDNLTIYGKKDSYAERYANENNIPFVPLISLSDNTTNIEIEYVGDSISENTSLKTKQLSETDEDYKNIILTDKIADSTVKPEDVVFTAYDISLVDANNNPVQPAGKVTVKIPCLANYNGENCKVYRVSDTDDFTDMNAIYQGGNMVFETEILGTYIITETELITQADVLLGDANGDGKTDLKDSAIIKRYIAGWDVEINMTAADMDEDGKVTIKDSALIKRQLAG